MQIVDGQLDTLLPAYTAFMESLEFQCLPIPWGPAPQSAIKSEGITIMTCDTADDPQNHQLFESIAITASLFNASPPQSEQAWLALKNDAGKIEITLFS